MAFVTRLEPDNKEEGSESPIFQFFVLPSLCEFLGVFLFVYWSIVVGLRSEFLLEGAKIDEDSLWLTTSLCEGLAALGLTLMLGGVSGAHFNPAVSLTSCLSGGLSPLLLPFYLVAQLFGAFLGALVAWASVNPNLLLPIRGKINLVDRETMNMGQGILRTWLLSSGLCLSYLMVGLGSGGKEGSRLRTALAMGSVVGVAGLGGGRLGVNPARSLAASAALGLSSDLPAWDLHSVLHLGPFLGALTAAALYRLVLAPNAQRLRLFPDHK